MAETPLRALDRMRPTPRPLAPAGHRERPHILSVDQAGLLADVEDDLGEALSALRRQSSSRRGSAESVSEDVEAGAHEDEASREEAHGAPPMAERVRARLAENGGNARDALLLAQALCPDPSDLALLLAGLREDEAIDAAVREELDRALDELVATHGLSALRAGANVARLAGAFARRTRLSSRTLRQAYLTLLAADTSVDAMYRYLIDAFGFARRGVALDFLELAAATDRACATPSRRADDYAPMDALLMRLRLLRSADALLVSARHGVDRRAAILDEALVELLLLGVLDIAAACQAFKRCLRDWMARAGAAQAARWSRAALYGLALGPVELYPDAAHRQALLDALHACLAALPAGSAPLDRSGHV